MTLTKYTLHPNKAKNQTAPSSPLYTSWPTPPPPFFTIFISSSTHTHTHSVLSSTTISLHQITSFPSQNFKIVWVSCALHYFSSSSSCFIFSSSSSSVFRRDRRRPATVSSSELRRVKNEFRLFHNFRSYPFSFLFFASSEGRTKMVSVLGSTIC